jgi:hypothetical protein
MNGPLSGRRSLSGRTLCRTVLALSFCFTLLGRVGAVPEEYPYEELPPPAPELRAEISTARGSGETAVYRMGEPLVVRFRIDGAEQAAATIDGIFANGESKTLFDDVVPGNQTITRTIATIGGEPGHRSLRLRAQIQDMVLLAHCDFVVQPALAPLPPLLMPAPPRLVPAPPAPAAEDDPAEGHDLRLIIQKVQLWHVTPGGPPYGLVARGATQQVDGAGNKIIRLKPNPGGAGHRQLLRVEFIGIDPSWDHFPMHAAFVDLSTSVESLGGSPNGKLLDPDNLPFLISTLGPGGHLRRGFFAFQRLNPWMTRGVVWWDVDGLVGKETKLIIGARCSDGHDKEELVHTIK